MSTPIPFPRMLAVRQKFPVSPPFDVPAVVQHEFKAQKVLSRLQPGAQIAVGVGSRGITNIKNIVAAVLAELKAASAKPFIIPAMGSHGGATPQGPIGVLESDGLTERSCGVAIIENQFHDTARIAVLHPTEIEPREKELLEEARRLLPRLPFDDIDVLIVDRIGKNISGSGMDPNVTGRWVHGYSTSLADDNRQSPRLRRILVRDLTPETHGNAIGIGFADLATAAPVHAVDKRVRLG